MLLKDNVRAATKTPGLFKTEQNYILNNILGNFTPRPPSLTVSILIIFCHISQFQKKYRN